MSLSTEWRSAKKKQWVQWFISLYCIWSISVHSLKFLVLRTYRRPSLDMWLEVCKLFERWRHSESSYVLFKWRLHLHFWWRNLASCGSKIILKSSPGGSKIEPGSLKIKPRELQNRARGALGSLLGSILGKRLDFRCFGKGPGRPKWSTWLPLGGPRAPKRGPRLSQPSPKWSPRCSQINFLRQF